MLIAIHQPNFLPWFGYFYKMARADVFVLYDDVQFTKGGYINRCAIKTPRGDEWLTVAVGTAGRLTQSINQVRFSSDKWRSRLMGKLVESYRTAPFFKVYIGKLEEEIAQECTLLADLNIRLMEMVRKNLGIDTQLVRSSQLDGITGSSTERLVSICQALGASAYLSGAGGRNYQEEEQFRNAGIKLEFNQFVHPTYPQLWGEFLPRLSIIDMLMNVGPEASQWFRSARKLQLVENSGAVSGD